MDLNESNDYSVNNLLDKLSKKNKTAFLLSNFNIDLLKYNQHSPTIELLDSFSSHLLLPHNVQPTRMRNNFKTLLDNIYSNVIAPNNKLGNFNTTISGHLPQFLIAPEISSNQSSNLKTTYLWTGNVDQSFISILIKLNSILDMYSPLKKISKQTLNLRNKPWITLGLQKSVSIKNSLLTKYIKSKYLILNTEAQEEFE